MEVKAEVPPPPAPQPQRITANNMKQQQAGKIANVGANGVPPPVKPEPAINDVNMSFGGQNEERKPFNQNQGNNQGGNRQNFGGRGGRGGGGNRFGGGRGGPGGGNNRNFQQNRNQNQNQDGNEGGSGGNQGDNRGGNQGDNRGDRMHLKGHNRGMRNGGGGEDFMINQKLSHLGGPTHEIQSIEHQEVKFSGRNRLYIGNLTSDITEEELKQLFEPYGETSEAFLNAEKFFAFIKVDFRANAEKAKRELDGFVRKSRALRVRFAPNATTIRVKNLTPFVTNELLHKSFEIFGQVERAVIVVDDRGKPTGEGIVEFTRKSGAMAAIRYCTEKCFFLTSSLRPCVCELFEHSDDTDGYPEKTINKKNQDFMNARSCGPRFAELASLEHEYGTRWKQLHDLYKQKHEALKNEMKMEEEKLEAQMEYARYEHETEMLRNQLRQREQDRDQRKTNWEMKERFADEQRMKNEEQMRRSQEEMAMKMSKQEEELRRRQQENTLFMQAQQLNSLLDAQENQQGGAGNIGNLNNLSNIGGGGGGGGGGMGGNISGGNNSMRKNFDGPPQNRNFQQGGMSGGNMANGRSLKCMWKGCRVVHTTVSQIETHVRNAHLGPKKPRSDENEDSFIDSDHEEEFYYTEVEDDDDESSPSPPSPPTLSHRDMARPPHEDPEYQRQIVGSIRQGLLSLSTQTPVKPPLPISLGGTVTIPTSPLAHHNYTWAQQSPMSPQKHVRLSPRPSTSYAPYPSPTYTNAIAAAQHNVHIALGTAPNNHHNNIHNGHHQLNGTPLNLSHSAPNHQHLHQTHQQLQQNRSPVSPNRRTRGENKKCRKVYGMDNKEAWCTQCKWKKACSRFCD